MNTLFTPLLLVLITIPCGVTLGQTADIPPQTTREGNVKLVSALMASRGVIPKVSEDTINPFLGKVTVATGGNEILIVNVPVGLSGPELLSQLANQIPATGSMQFKGEQLLLMGSKRAKIGESISVTRDGKNFDLTLVNISPTTFTVKMGESISTRPIRKR